jgi:hypothetical protein
MNESEVIPSKKSNLLWQNGQLFGGSPGPFDLTEKELGFFLKLR